MSSDKKWFVVLSMPKTGRQMCALYHAAVMKENPYDAPYWVRIDNVVVGAYKIQQTHRAINSYVKSIINVPDSNKHWWTVCNDMVHAYGMQVFAFHGAKDNPFGNEVDLFLLCEHYCLHTEKGREAYARFKELYVFDIKKKNTYMLKEQAVKVEPLNPRVHIVVRLDGHNVPHIERYEADKLKGALDGYRSLGTRQKFQIMTFKSWSVDTNDEAALDAAQKKAEACYKRLAK